jgi:hypothetical protein
MKYSTTARCPHCKGSFSSAIELLGVHIATYEQGSSIIKKYDCTCPYCENDFDGYTLFMRIHDRAKMKKEENTEEEDEE